MGGGGWAGYVMIGVVMYVGCISGCGVAMETDGVKIPRGAFCEEGTPGGGMA